MGEQLMRIMLNGSDLTVTPPTSPIPFPCRAVVEEVLSKGEPVYGLTTGAGERKAFGLDPARGDLPAPPDLAA
jgi:histidine ammonia-lyase